MTSDAPVSRRGPARSWVAAIGEPDPAERLPSLPERRPVVEGAGGGPGLLLLAPAGADLPATAAEGGVGVVFEGVLHDRAALAARLGAPARSSDAELVLAAYRRRGDELVHELRGSYAFVVWDGGERRLLAVRDRLGIYPLHRTATPRETLFSTSPAILRLHPRTDSTLHRAVLAEILCYRFLDVRETAWAGIERIPPGHLWRRDGRGERLELYWRPGRAGASSSTPAEVAAEFDELLDRAVRRCLDEGPAAIFLSGGLDSVSLAAIAGPLCAAAGEPPPFALSLIFPDAEADEREVQGAVARQLGLPQILLGFEEASGGGNPLLASAATSPLFPAPVLTPWRAAYLGLGQEIRRQGRAAVLTGHGGDEWLGVSLYLAADYLRRGELRALRRFWQARRRSFRLSIARSAQFVLWRYGLRPLLVAATIRALGAAAPKAVAARRRRHVRLTTPAWVAPDPALRRELVERGERLLPATPAGDFYQVAHDESIAHAQATWELEEIYETSRLNRAPTLSPFLDSELVEFLHRVPPEQLNAGGRSKGLVRSALARRFPALGFERQMKVAATPYFRTLVAEAGPEALQALDGLPTLSGVGILAPGSAPAIMRALIDRPRQETARLWFALSMEAWVRYHLGHTPSGGGEFS